MKWLPIVVLSAALGACQTTVPPESGYYRTDGTPLTPGSPAEQQFWSDRAVCLGEMSKAKMSGTVIDTGSPLIDATNNVQRQQDAGTVMLGCMAQKGYYVKIGDQSSLQQQGVIRKTQ